MNACNHDKFRLIYVSAIWNTVFVVSWTPGVIFELPKLCTLSGNLLLHKERITEISWHPKEYVTFSHVLKVPKLSLLETMLIILPILPDLTSSFILITAKSTSSWASSIFNVIGFSTYTSLPANKAFFANV